MYSNCVYLYSNTHVYSNLIHTLNVENMSLLNTKITNIKTLSLIILYISKITNIVKSMSKI